MDGFNIPGLTEGLIFFYYILPILLLLWLVFEIGRFNQSFTKGRPIGLASAVAAIILYIDTWLSGLHGGNLGIVSGILIVIVLGAGALERARRKTPFGPNSVAISVVVSIVILYAWGLLTSNMLIQPAPTGAYILVIICLALGLYGRRMAKKSQSTKSPKGSRTKK